MIVADTGPLILFSRINRLDLLSVIAGEVAVPQAVRDELEAGSADRSATAHLMSSPWLRLIAVSTSSAATPSALHKGEWEAMVLASDLGVPLLIDEKRGRSTARVRGVETIGSLFIIAKAKQEGLIEEVSPLVMDMRAAGYRLSTALVEAFLRREGELFTE